MTILLTALLLVAGLQNKPVNPDAQTVADFKARVDKYVEVRKKADDSALPLKKTPEPSRIREGQQGLTERVGAARTDPTSSCASSSSRCS